MIIYRRDRIPELRQILAGLPNHGSITDANNALEVAIDHYIDFMAPGDNPVQAQEQNIGGENNEGESFVVLQPEYNVEAATWGGRRRRRTKRSRRGKRRSTRR